MNQDEAIEECLAAIRPAIVRLFEYGEAAARDRLISLLQGEVIAPSKQAIRQTISNVPSLGYGALTKRVRDVLVNVAANQPDGVDSEAVHAACSDLSAIQVRSALKTLNKTGDITRLSRGRYLPAQNFAQAKSGGVAPPVPETDFSQSMEVASHDPKGNGAP